MLLIGKLMGDDVLPQPTLYPIVNVPSEGRRKASNQVIRIIFVIFVLSMPGPAVHSIVVWRDVLILTFLPASLS